VRSQSPIWAASTTTTCKGGRSVTMMSAVMSWHSTSRASTTCSSKQTAIVRTLGAQRCNRRSYQPPPWPRRSPAAVTANAGITTAVTPPSDTSVGSSSAVAHTTSPPALVTAFHTVSSTGSPRTARKPITARWPCRSGARWCATRPDRAARSVPVRPRRHERMWSRCSALGTTTPTA